jgi:transposase
MPLPLRGDFDAAQLRAIARRTKDAAQTRRLLALAAVYDGATRTAAALIGGVTLQIVRDWVLKFNAIAKRSLGEMSAKLTAVRPGWSTASRLAGRRGWMRRTARRCVR